MEKEEKKEQAVEKAVEKEEYVLVQVPTQYTTAVQTPTKEKISTEMAIVKILNDVEEIKKSVA